eukprot:16388-Heterococcus_DN1.PRE.3
MAPGQLVAHTIVTELPGSCAVGNVSTAHMSPLLRIKNDLNNTRKAVCVTWSLSSRPCCSVPASAECTSCCLVSQTCDTALLVRQHLAVADLCPLKT